MITALYASFCAVLIVSLARNVIMLRRTHRVMLGDGGYDDLQSAIRTHGNAIEYIPLTLILMILLELSGGPWWLIHTAGIMLIAGRLIHVSALKNNDVKRRVLGMKVTLYLIMILAVLNVVYFAYNSFLGLTLIQP